MNTYNIPGIIRQILISLFSGVSYFTFIQGEILDGIVASVLGIATVIWGILAHKDRDTDKAWQVVLRYGLSGISGILFGVAQYFQNQAEKSIYGSLALLAAIILSSLVKKEEPGALQETKDQESDN